MKYFIFLGMFLLIFFPCLTYADTRYSISTENSPFIGKIDAPVTIIEFIDYQ